MEITRIICLALIFWVISPFCIWGDSSATRMPDGFVDLQAVIPSIVVDLRYYTSHNFVGESIPGYNASRCFVTRETAHALKKVQRELSQRSLSLKMYDCYRPQRAVDKFVEWAMNSSDQTMKKEFYPTMKKTDLFRKGYIARKSGHSSGSTVDLTIVPVPVPEQEEYLPGQELSECYLSREHRFQDNSIDMGTGFDCFHEFAETQNTHITPQQRQNRLLLKTLMEKYGFRNYSKEWWHFTLREEPFPNTYFDFVIEEGE
ncbi:M15 family metallopeptidase [bacterium]|nr:M15 family metallopeptidase [candidate division CSSED10-310 bacterium]